MKINSSNKNAIKMEIYKEVQSNSKKQKKQKKRRMRVTVNRLTNQILITNHLLHRIKTLQFLASQ